MFHRFLYSPPLTSLKLINAFPSRYDYAMTSQGRWLLPHAASHWVLCPWEVDPAPKTGVTASRQIISCWKIGCIQKMSWEQVQWFELCSLPSLGVSVVVFGFTVQDPAGTHHLFICSSVPSHMSLLLLCLLLLPDSPHELHSPVFWLHLKFSYALVKVHASFLVPNPTSNHMPALLC